MESALINQLATVVSDAKAPATGKASNAEGEGSSSFFAMLSRLSGGGQGGQATSGVEGTGAEDLFGTPDDPFAALLASDMEGLLKMLQAMAQENESPLAAINGCSLSGENRLETAGQTPDEQVKSLLVGLLALFLMKKGGTAAGDGNPSADDRKALSAALQSLGMCVDAEEKANGESDGVAMPAEASSGKPSDAGDQSAQELLALIVFSSLQALVQKQNEEQPLAVALGRQLTGEADAQASGEAGSGIMPEAVSGPAQSGPHTVMPQKEGLERLLDILDAGQGPSQSASETEMTAAVTEIRLLPQSEEGPAGKSDLTLTVTGPFRNIGQNGQAANATADIVARLSAVDDQRAETREDSPAATTIVSDLSSLIGSGDEKHTDNDAGDNDRPSGGTDYQFAGGQNLSKTTGEEPQAKAVHQTASAGAVERFERILEQFNARAPHHDLTVRLELGNKESVLLGFKDMGQNITVEVKASHQAITDLLQTQKDLIIKHLESKDVHATFQIDPDASATPDRRDRRESKELHRGPFSNPSGEGEGFGEYLEVFA